MLEELALPLPQIIKASASAEVDLTALVHEHAALLFRVAYSLLRNRTEAEDTVQDTFLRVLEHRHKLPAVRDLRPWLVRITWNAALDRRRRKRPEQADELFLQGLVARDLPTDEALDSAEQSRRVLAALDRLPKPERQALLLCALEEMSTAEIAAVMGKSESAIRALLHRARTHLRSRVESGRPKGGKR